MSAEVFGDRDKHPGFSTTAMLIAVLAGALIAGVLLYPWQRGVVRDRERTIAAMAAAHETMQAQVDSLRGQFSDLQDKVATFRGQAKRSQERLGDTRQRLYEERSAHRQAEAQARVLAGAPLADGRYMAYVDGVQLGTPSFLAFDMISVYRGQAATKQARQAGATPDAEGIFTVNRSHAKRSLEIGAGVTPEVNYWHRDTIKTGLPVSLETFANVMDGTEGWQVSDQETRYWLTVQDERITAVEPYFTVIAC